MKTKIQVNSTKSLWVPPFSKETESEELAVNVGEEFHTDKITKQNVFKLLDANSHHVILGYNNTFHLKRTKDELEELIYNGQKALKLQLGKNVSFSHMWGDYGITKTVSYLAPKEEESIEEEPESIDTPEQEEESEQDTEEELEE
jgi:hypothetical protein